MTITLKVLAALITSAVGVIAIVTNESQIVGVGSISQATFSLVDFYIGKSFSRKFAVFLLILCNFLLLAMHKYVKAIFWIHFGISLLNNLVILSGNGHHRFGDSIPG